MKSHSYILIVFALCVSSVSAQSPFSPFFDDFEDGSVVDDTPVSLAPSQSLPTRITIHDGEITLTDPTPGAFNFSLGMTEVTQAGRPVQVDEVSVQTVFRVSDGRTFAGIWTRGQFDAPEGDGGSYFGVIDGGGIIRVGSLRGGNTALATPLNPVAYDVVLQLDTVGAEVTATAWSVAEPTMNYSATWVDTVARPAGAMGQVLGNWDGRATGVSATFRSLEVRPYSEVWDPRAPLTPFVDDFEDDSVGDDAPVSLVSSRFPVSIDVNEGDMILSEPFQLEGLSLGLTIVTKRELAVLADEVSAQTVVRVSDPWTFAGIWTRGEPAPPEGDGGSYFGVIGGDGVLTVGSFTGQWLTLQTPLDPVSYDVVLQFDTVGTHVIATAWPVADVTLKYSMTFVDSEARPAGTMGQVLGRWGDDASGAWAIFRSLQMLEPTFVPFEPFVDDFKDNSVDDDSPVSIVSGGLPSTITVARGNMMLTEPLQLEGFSIGLTNVMKGRRLVHAEDASAQAVVRVSDPMAFAGLYTRGQTDASGGDGGAYFGNIRGDGLITTGSFTGEQLTLETPLDPVNTDVVLQVDTVGANVTTTAWAVDDPASKYSITIVDTLARPAGFMGQSFGRVGDDATGAWATFRSLQVLEPDAVEPGEGL